MLEPPVCLGWPPSSIVTAPGSNPSPNYPLEVVLAFLCGLMASSGESRRPGRGAHSGLAIARERLRQPE
jgi:hypothetical protein